MVVFSLNEILQRKMLRLAAVMSGLKVRQCIEKIKLAK